MQALEKVAAGGFAGASLRNKTSHRKITTLDKDGNPVRVVTDEQLAMTMLQRVGIEFDVVQGQRTMTVCEVCSALFRPKKGATTIGKVRCKTCIGDVCKTCNQPLPKGGRGKAAACRTCFHSAKGQSTLVDSSGMPVVDLTGQVFGKLTAVSLVVGKSTRTSMGRMWLCQCECGGQIEVSITKLHKKDVRTCGCGHKPAMLTAQGRTMHLKEWAKETGISYATLAARVRNGWDPERIVSAGLGGS